MNEPSPYQRLGVTETATFEEIQEAKRQLEQKYSSDPKLLESLETAYDAVIMDRLKRRQEGRIKVPDRIRFPEQITEFKQPSTPPAAQRSNWLKRLLDTPSVSEVMLPAGIFTILAVLTLLVSTESYLSLLMALGSFTAVYFIYRKERRLGRAVLLSLVGLFVGVGLGYLLFASLQTSNIALPLAGEQISAMAVFLVSWLIASFLR